MAASVSVSFSSLLKRWLFLRRFVLCSSAASDRARKKRSPDRVWLHKMHMETCRSAGTSCATQGPTNTFNCKT
jgi:hypothetical protein